MADRVDAIVIVWLLQLSKLKYDCVVDPRLRLKREHGRHKHMYVCRLYDI